MPYLGSAPAEKALAASDIASDAVTTAKIANDAVDVTKINLISTSSVPSVEAKGDGSSDGYIQLNCSQNSHGIKLKSPPHSAAQSYTLTYPQSIVTDGFLKTDSGGALSFAAVPADGYAYVSTQTASSDSDLSFTNMASGYDYLYVLEDIASANNSVGFKAELGVAGPTYRTSSYKSATTSINNSGNSQSGESTSQIHIIDQTVMEAMGNGTNESIQRGTLELTNPAGTDDMTPYFGVASFNGENNMVPLFYCGAYLGGAEAHTSIRFLATSGNIASGAILQYRRKRS